MKNTIDKTYKNSKVIVESKNEKIGKEPEQKPTASKVSLLARSLNRHPSKTRHPKAARGL